MSRAWVCSASSPSCLRSWRILPLALALCVVAGCGRPEDSGEISSDQVAREIADAVKEQTGARPAEGSGPCELLSKDLLTAHFDLGAAELSHSPSKYSPDPLCIVTWPKPNAAEIEERRAAAMTEYMRKKMSGEQVELPMLRSDNEVSLTLPKRRFDDPQAAMKAFDAAMRVLNEGMTVTVKGEGQETPTYETEPVSGIGDKAMWAPRMRQLSVVSGTRIFHVGVIADEDPEIDLAKAKALARDLNGRL